MQITAALRQTGKALTCQPQIQVASKKMQV